MKIRLKIFCIILSLLLALFAVGTAFAWFTIYTRQLNLDGAAAGAYFAYGNGASVKEGDGEKVGPFGITNQTHLYNLAWLQNTGRLKDKNYYFELGNDIVMGKGYILPPIGNEENPFNGTFNGNGHTITNLVISTNKDVLYANAAAEDYTFSNSVGFFGKTGPDSEIKNFILDNPTVEVASALSGQNTKYADITETDPAAVGLAIGYVGQKASSIGVIGGSLVLRADGYSTVNSIIGSINPEYKDNNNLTGGAGGSGSNFGASFDVEAFYDRLVKISDNQFNFSDPDAKNVKDKGATEKDPSVVSPYLPKLDHSENYWKLLDQSQWMPISAKPEDSEQPNLGSTYVGADARELASDNNVGYFIGGENKFDNFSITFDNELEQPSNDYADWTIKGSGDSPGSSNVPRGLYTYEKKYIDDTDTSGYYLTTSSSYTTSSGFKAYAVNDTEIANLPQGIQDLFVPVNQKINYTSIRLESEINAYTDLYWYPNGGGSQQYSDHGQISWMGKTYGTETEPVAIPNSGIWFKPAHYGTMRFVVIARKDKEELVLRRVYREKATSENPFYIERTDNQADTGLVSSTSTDIIINVKLPQYIMFYFEFPITTEKDLKSEYIIGSNTGSGVRFLYLDIGASAEEGPKTDQADPEKYISAIDFIYQGVTILQTDYNSNDVTITAGSFVKGGAVYTETGVMLAFTGNGAVIYLYYRDENGTCGIAGNGKTIAVGYTTNLPEDWNDKAYAQQMDGYDVTVDGDYNAADWKPTS